jgi:hypothetical protein
LTIVSSSILTLIFPIPRDRCGVTVVVERAPRGREDVIAVVEKVSTAKGDEVSVVERISTATRGVETVGRTAVKMGKMH